MLDKGHEDENLQNECFLLVCTHRLLKERAQGVPYWCEQLLVDMAEKKQILVVSDTGSSSQYEDTIAPVPNQIRRLSIDSTEEEEDIEIRRINPVFKEQVVCFYIV